MYHTEYESTDRYLRVNNCAIQYLGDADHNTVREEGRRDFHILYIMKGCCHAEVNGAEYTATEGMAVLFRPGERQAYRFYKKDDSVSLYIHFCGTQCEKYLKQLGLYGQACFYVGMDPVLVNALKSMVLSNELGAFDEDVCAGWLCLALSLMSRNMKYGCNLRHFDEIGAAVEHMNRNISDNLPNSFYAALCHMSISRFEHLFKEVMGSGPRTYMLKARIERAKRLLEDTALSNWEISEQLGFDNPNYFSRLFKKYTGMTAGAWRRQKLRNIL